MANPVLESSAQAVVSNAPLVITNPTGLSAGDEMLLFVTMYETGSSQTVNTPSGWTSRVNSANSFVTKACFTKTATSTDVSNGSVTVTSSGGSDHFVGSLHRITGSALGSEISGVEFDAGSVPATSFTYTTTLTPTTSESLVVIYFGAASSSGMAATPTVSSYSLTPAITLTEAADIGRRDGGGAGVGQGVAYGDYDGTTEITSRAATFSETMTRDAGGIIIIYSAPQDATGTNTLHEASPVLFTNAGVESGTTGTNTLMESSPTFFDQSGRATSPAVWTNEDKPSTNWTNE